MTFLTPLSSRAAGPMGESPRPPPRRGFRPLRGQSFVRSMRTVRSKGFGRPRVVGRFGRFGRSGCFGRFGQSGRSSGGLSGSAVPGLAVRGVLPGPSPLFFSSFRPRLNLDSPYSIRDITLVTMLSLADCIGNPDSNLVMLLRRLLASR